MHKLPHWILTDKQHAFYDSESATAIEQTAKLYAAVQEIIENINVNNQTLEDFLKKFDGELSETTKEMLIQWYEDGTLSKIINDDVFSMKANSEDLQQLSVIVDVKGDGVTDETEAIQTLANNLEEGQTLTFPYNKEIVITKPIKFEKSNITIDLNSSTILYKGNESLGETNGKDRTQCAFIFNGTVDNSKTTIISSVEPNYKVNGVSQPRTKITLTTAASDYYAIGDLVKVFAYNLETWSEEFTDNPAIINTICKITDIDGQAIVVDINPDFVFNVLHGTVTKINQLSNITIKDFKFVDMNESGVPSEPTDAERESWVGGLRFNKCENVVIDGFYATKHRFPGIMFDHVYRANVSNFTATNPRSVSAGCGYGLQIGGSSHCEFNNLYGESLRHLIDFTSSGHCIVTHATQTKEKSVSFDLHGQGEFDITFNHCIGGGAIGNGISEFQCVASGITFNHFEGSLNVEWCKDIKILNSKLYLFEKLRTYLRAPQLVIKDSKIYSSEGLNWFVAATRNGAYTNTNLTISNCDVHTDVSYQTSGSLFYGIGYAHVIVENNRFYNSLGYTISMNFNRCKMVSIVRNQLTNVVTEFLGDNASNYLISSQDMANALFVFTNNKLDINSSNTNINLINTNGPSMKRTLYYIEGNTVNAPNNTPNLMRLGGTFENNEVNVHINNNAMYGAGYGMAIHNVPLLKIHRNNNFIENINSKWLVDNRRFDSVDVTANSTSVNVTFDIAEPDDTYEVHIYDPSWTTNIIVPRSQKTSSGFNIAWDTNPTGNSVLYYDIVRA